ncbi:MAG: DUF92 domain-containing protein [Acidobacteriota bacterium]
MTRAYTETGRKLLHIGMGGFALVLRVVSWQQAAVCAVGALLFNLFVLPRVFGHSFHRPEDRSRGYSIGIVLYPLSVLLLILAFPDRLDIVAAAWGILAVGDGSATIIGRACGRHPLPWQPDKTVEGLVAFVMLGGAAGILLAWWTAPAVAAHPPVEFIVVAPVLAALAAGLAETIPVKLDDNLTVPAVAGTTLWLLGFVTTDAWIVAQPVVWQWLPLALVVNTAVAFGGWRAGTVRASGVLVGWAIGVTVLACAGPAGWTLLFVTFLAATVSSRLGLKKKALLGIAEERGGHRGGGNAFANTGLAAVAALLAVLTPFHDAAMLAFVAVLATGGSDTVASEIGKAWGGQTYLVTTFSRVRPGTPGAMSLEGTVAGVIAAVALAVLGAWLQLIPVACVWMVVVGAIAGSLVESALAATLEAPGVVNNDVLNFLNTATGAIVAIVLMRVH